VVLGLLVVGFPVGNLATKVRARPVEAEARLEILILISVHLVKRARLQFLVVCLLLVNLRPRRYLLLSHLRRAGSSSAREYIYSERRGITSSSSSNRSVNR